MCRSDPTAHELAAERRARLATELARQRDRHGLTLREVCAACGISSPSVLWVWEHGQSPPAAAQERLANFYGLPLERLFPAPPPATGRIRQATRIGASR